LVPELAGRIVPIERLEEAVGRRSSGVSAIDELLGGGWPRAALSEIAGRRSSGRTAVLLRTLAAAIAAGETTALVDAGGTLDPRAAAACGIPLHQLLWIRCPAAQALKATDLVVAAGGFGVVALDVCEAGPRLRIPDAAWVRLKHGAHQQGTTVLVATGGRLVGTNAAAAVELSDSAPTFFTDGPPLFADLRARAARVRGGRPSERHEPPPCVSLVFTSRS
jgi:protein ImuA